MKKRNFKSFKFSPLSKCHKDKKYQTILLKVLTALKMTISFNIFTIKEKKKYDWKKTRPQIKSVYTPAYIIKYFSAT